MNAHKDCGQNYFAPLLDCDCQVCKDAREIHDTAIRKDEMEKMLKVLDELYKKAYCKADCANLINIPECQFYAIQVGAYKKAIESLRSKP